MKSKPPVVTQTIAFDGRQNRRHFLRHIIETHGFTTMIEVGVRDGRTTFYLLDHITDLSIIGVDTRVRQFYSPKVAEQYGHRLTALQGVSWQVASTIADNSVDMIFIDADHSYAAVRRDIIAYTPKLKPGGVLCGHDIDYAGVYQAVNELIGDYGVGPNNVWIKKGA